MIYGTVARALAVTVAIQRSNQAGELLLLYVLTDNVARFIYCLCWLFLFCFFINMYRLRRQINFIIS